MASIKIPTMPTLPSLPSMPSIPAEAAIDAAMGAAKDAAYVTVGLGVLAFQQAQVRRRELVAAATGQFETGKAQLDEVVDALEARIGSLDSRFDALEVRLDAAVDSLGKRLPASAGTVLTTANETAKTARKQVRNLIVSAT